MLIGYARTSTLNQVAGLEAQEAARPATGCTKLFRKQASSVGQRDQLAAALDFVRERDTLVVSRIDRLARSTADLLGIVAALEGKQVALRILDFGGSEVDTRSPTGRMLLTMFAAVAEFERAVMLERQRAGIAAAKAAGRYKGRAPTARCQGKRVAALYAEGLGASAIAAAVGISRVSIYEWESDLQGSLGRIWQMGNDTEISASGSVGLAPSLFPAF
jgi:DNA invertase Pin-like site-specific DNA recombinase